MIRAAQDSDERVGKQAEVTRRQWRVIELPLFLRAFDSRED